MDAALYPVDMKEKYDGMVMKEKNALKRQEDPSSQKRQALQGPKVQSNCVNTQDAKRSEARPSPGQVVKVVGSKR